MSASSRTYRPATGTGAKVPSCCFDHRHITYLSGGVAASLGTQACRPGATRTMAGVGSTGRGGGIRPSKPAKSSICTMFPPIAARLLPWNRLIAAGKRGKTLGRCRERQAYPRRSARSWGRF